MKNKFKILILILFITQNMGFCAEISSQTLSANLGEVLEISKIIVEGVEYDVDSPLINVKKENTTKTARTTNVNLTPIKVKIHTNVSTPIYVSAEFQQLNHDENLHNFKVDDLSFFPEKIVINDPYDNVITDEFIPQVNVRSDAVKGFYTGQILFTLGAI